MKFGPEAIFGVITVLFIILMIVYSGNIYYSNFTSIFVDIEALLYLSISISFAIFRDRRTFRNYEIALLCLFVLLMVISIYSMFGIPLIAESFALGFFAIGIILAILLPVSIALLLGFYILKAKILGKYSNCIAILLVIMAVILFFYYQIYGFAYLKISSDDETAISYYSFNAIQSGHDPYSININSILKNNATTYGFTVADNNHIIGYLDYPILFVLIMIPFYVVSGGSAAHVISLSSFYSYFIFTIIALAVFAASVSKYRLNKIKSLIIPLFVFALYFVQISSEQSIAIIILLILVIYSIDKWYAFVFLGLAASLQELVWIPVLFSIAYIAGKYGIKNGVKCFLGAALVFLLVNSYFILEGPVMFLSNVFAPVNGGLLPFLLSPIPSLLMIFYPISIHALEYLFYISILIGAAVVYFTRNKLLIASMSLFAFFVLYHTITVYFAMAVALSFIILVIDTHKSEEPKKMPKAKKKAPLKNSLAELIGSKKFATFSLTALAIVFIGIIIYSHYSFVNDFGLHVAYEGTSQNGSYELLRIGDYGSGALNMSMIGIYSTNSIVENTEGLSVSDPIYISNMSYCNQSCKKNNYINYNILHLEKGDSYTATLLIPNDTVELRCILYDENYYYECGNVYFNLTSRHS